MSLTIGINGRFLTQPLTGVQRYAHCWVAALDQLLTSAEFSALDWQVTLYTPALTSCPDIPLSNLNAISLRQIGRLKGYGWEQLELPWYSHDHVLINLGNVAPVGSLWGRQLTMVTVHDLSFLTFPQSYSLVYRFVYQLLTPLIMNQADRILTVSQTEAKSILTYYPQAQSRLFAIPNGAWPSHLSLDSIPAKNPLGRRFVLAVGTLSERKNLRGILAAAALVNQQQPLDFVFVGGRPGIYQAIQVDLPKQLQERVHFLGPVSDPDLIGYYKAAAALVYPSFYEASGLPPTEAMACGCPVIVSDIPALEERCGDAALYCQAANPATIASTILDLVNNPILQNTLKLKGLQRAQALTWENSVRQSLEVMQACLAAKHPPQPSP